MAKINVASAGFFLAGVLFIVAGLIQTLKGRPPNAMFMTLGASMLIFGIVLRQKPGGPPGSAGT